MNNKVDDLKEKIVNYSKKRGINALGFLKAEPFFRDLERYNYALKNNYLSSFINKNNEDELLDGYKSIICVLVSYPNPTFYKSDEMEEELNKNQLGKLSSSSWGLDYHKVLTDILEDLVGYLKGFCKVEKYKISVDKTNLSEREIAVKAGLGWIGRNSNLINKELGSFVFIGTIFVDLDLDLKENKISNNLCANCNLCVEACPVGAIKGKTRVIDTNLCLSQQTQEKEITSKFIKRNIKEMKYLYGCDICQEICPWNKKKREINPLFSPIKEEVYINLNELSKESNKSFKKKYGHLSGSWRGKKIWIRNAEIILSNFDV